MEVIWKELERNLEFLDLNLNPTFGTYQEICSNTRNGDLEIPILGIGDLEIPSQDFQMVIQKFQVQFGNSTHIFYLSTVDVLKIVLCAINNNSN